MNTVTLRRTGDTLPREEAEGNAKFVYGEFSEPSRSSILAELALVVAQPKLYTMSLSSIHELENWQYLGLGNHEIPQRLTTLGRVASNMIEVTVYDGSESSPELDFYLVEPFKEYPVLKQFSQPTQVSGPQVHPANFRRSRY